MKKNVLVFLMVFMSLTFCINNPQAMASMRDTGHWILETEKTDGYYEEWPAEKRMQLINDLVTNGYIEKTDDVDKLQEETLPDEEKIQLANKIMAEFTGNKVYDLSFMFIMQAAWGSFLDWTKEEQAWYSQQMVEMGLQGHDHTHYVMPEGRIGEAQAIEIARAEVAKGFDIEASTLDGYTVTTTFQIPEFAEAGDDQPYWCVEFWNPKDQPEDERLFPISLSVFVHPDTGELLIPMDEMVKSVWAYMKDID